MTEEQRQVILDDLIATNLEGKPLIGRGALVYLNAENDIIHTRYLSGIPYLWTAYVAKAFRFASHDQALQFIGRHLDVLDKAIVCNLEKL